MAHLSVATGSGDDDEDVSIPWPVVDDGMPRLLPVPSAWWETPAVTTRGMSEREMQQIAKLIDKVIASSGDPAVASSVKEEVLDLTNRFPLYKSFPSMADKK